MALGLQATKHRDVIARPLEAVEFDPARPGRFSLLFTAFGPESAKQGIYLLAHERLGGLGLFMVPLAPRQRPAQAPGA